MQGSAALGVAILGTIAADHTKTLTASGHPLAAALTGGYQVALTVAAACVAVGIVLALVGLPSPPRAALDGAGESPAVDEREIALEAA